MGSIDEIRKTILDFTKKENTINNSLHCNSLYPPKSTKLILNNIKYFNENYILSGFSDHTIINYYI